MKWRLTEFSVSALRFESTANPRYKLVIYRTATTYAAYRTDDVEAGHTLSPERIEEICCVASACLALNDGNIRACPLFDD